MADPFKQKTMKRKNVKGLALSAPPPKPVPSPGDAQIPGANANDEKQDTLEIGVEFQLDLKAEDLVVLRELGSGNGGTVSKVQHTATKVIMARKVRCTGDQSVPTGTNDRRSYTSKQRTRFESESCASYALCTTATRTTLSISTVLSKILPAMS